ncbi:unnamed protein product [Camellia sinensis]
MEKACVFFSVLLHNNFSKMAWENFGKVSRADSTFLLDSFARCLHTVMYDVETRSAFTELYFSGELLILIEDFLLERRVLRNSNDDGDDDKYDTSRENGDSSAKVEEEPKCHEIAHNSGHSSNKESNGAMVKRESEVVLFNRIVVLNCHNYVIAVG